MLVLDKKSYTPQIYGNVTIAYTQRQEIQLSANIIKINTVFKIELHRKDDGTVLAIIGLTPTGLIIRFANNPQGFIN